MAQRGGAVTKRVGASGVGLGPSADGACFTSRYGLDYYGVLFRLLSMKMIAAQPIESYLQAFALRTPRWSRKSRDFNRLDLALGVLLLNISFVRLASNQVRIG